MLSLLIIVTLAAAADDQKVRSWAIYSDSTSCIAERNFDDGTTVAFSLDHEQEDSTITLWNDRWKSIDKDDSYRVSVQFDDSAPKIYKSEGMKTDASGGIYISTDGVDTIAEAMGAKYVTFRNGPKLIGRYNLNGSYKALLAVARCNGKAANTRSADPFAK